MFLPNNHVIMKKVVLFFNLIIIAVSIFGQEEERIFRQTDSKSILGVLYDGEHFNNNEVLWIPNYAERISMPVSDDGFCHTFIDTILSYSNNYSNYHVLILTTFEYSDGYKVDCHACYPNIGIATFLELSDGSWRILSFKKNFIDFGSYGERGDIELIKLGKEKVCLKLRSKIDGGQGEFYGSESFFFLPFPDKEVFSYVYYADNTGSSSSSEEPISFETTMKAIPTEDFFDIVLEINDKINSKVKTQFFIYDYTIGAYIEKK